MLISLVLMVSLSVHYSNMPIQQGTASDTGRDDIATVKQSSKVTIYCKIHLSVQSVQSS